MLREVNKKIDMAVNYNEMLNQFLCQGIDERSDFEATKNSLISMFN